MDRTKAIKYLNERGRIGKPLNRAKFKEEDEKEIEIVMKEGKIYGDPIAKLNSW